MLNLLRVTLSKFNFSLRNPRIKQTNKSSDSVILCGKFQTALSGGNKSTDSGGQQSLKILSYNIMPLKTFIWKYAILKTGLLMHLYKNFYQLN